MALALSRDGGAPRRVADGARLAPDTRLLLRFAIDKPGFVRLVRADAGSAEVIFPPWGERRFASGEHDMLVKGELQAVSLDGLAGRQLFVAIWSGRPLPASRAKSLAKRLFAGGAPQVEATGAVVATLGISVLEK